MENNGFEDLTEMTRHGTRPVDIVLERNEPVTVWISTNAQEALFAKLPEWESWASTIYVHFSQHFLIWATDRNRSLGASSIVPVRIVETALTRLRMGNEWNAYPSNNAYITVSKTRVHKPEEAAAITGYLQSDHWWLALLEYKLQLILRE